VARALLRAASRLFGTLLRLSGVSTLPERNLLSSAMQSIAKRIAVAALILNCSLNAVQAQAQPLGQPPEFEVASIKPNKTNERMYFGLRNNSLTIRNMTAKGVIQTAYGKRNFQISGGPPWLTSECFDIDAGGYTLDSAYPNILCFGRSRSDHRLQGVGCRACRVLHQPEE